MTKVAKEEFYGLKKPIKICDNVSMLMSQNQSKQELILSIWMDIENGF